MTTAEADLFLDENSQVRYRTNHGRGAAVGDEALRAEVVGGRIDSTLPPEMVQRIEQFRNRLDVRAMSTSMGAAEQTGEQRMVRRGTDALDSLTGSLPSYLGDPLNRAGVGGLHLVGGLAAFGAQIERTVHDGMRAVLPDSVGARLTVIDEQNRRTSEALTGAQTEVTGRDSMDDRVAAAAGIQVPLAARLARDLPRTPEMLPDMVRGAVGGDFVERQTTGTVIGQVAGGLVPGLGQAGDVRDLTAAGGAVARGEEGSAWRLGIAAVGVLPLGELLRLRRAGDAAEEVVPLGGRVVGEVSRRDFDPDAIGIPIRHLTTDNIRITPRGIDYVERHLSRFEPDEWNQGMLERLRNIADGRLTPTQQDLNFYAHELRESVRYRNLGYPSGQPDGIDARYDLWNNTHSATLEDYGIRESRNPLSQGERT
ncbi:MAG: hypothetical protein M3430_14890 [Acidobacteriota bacterium]|nr:hypothetical protein [Acidobacteriota bacterium]